MKLLKKEIEYLINEKSYRFSIDGSSDFVFGKDEILSQKDTDITYFQPWYEDGYTVIPFLNDNDYQIILKGLTDCVSKIIKNEINISANNFSLEKYHTFVLSDQDHFKVVSKTRDLFPDDFNLDIYSLMSRFNEILGFELSDFDKKTSYKAHIIVRINRPNSTDFNPPHKDIYEHLDDQHYIPEFINFWIPVCGVNEKSSLPIVPKSHRLPEFQIERTVDGGVIAGNKYRVRNIKSWNGSNRLYRANIKEGELLLFSPHLVHGLGVNENENITRVALEFRLYKK